MAARARRRARAVQDLLDLQFHRRRQYRPGDGCAARRFRRRHRAGDAGFSGNRPHRLPGQSVRRRRAAERKPAEGPSAQPDARFQPGAGAGAPEQDQDRAGRSCDLGARCGCRSRTPRRSRGQGRRCRHYRRRVRSRSRNHRPGRAGSPPVGRRLRHRARSRPRAGRLRQGQIERGDNGIGSRVGGPAACLAGSCSQATLEQIASAERTMAVLHLDPEQVIAGPDEARRALAWAASESARARC